MPSIQLADAFRSHPVNLHQKHNINDFTSLKELPDSYKWSTRIDHDTGRTTTNEPVPVIDLSRPGAMREIGHACRDWGVFQVVNHGVPTEVVDHMEKNVGGEFFGLPMHEKLKAARSPDGVSGFGLARISSFFPKLMWSEGFTLVGSPAEHFEKVWPQDYKQFCDIVEGYEKEMQKLASRLMDLILGSLGITTQDLNWDRPVSSSSSSAAIQLNHYPACPDPDQAMGLAPHTDSTLVTILHQNDTSGLQVLRDGGAQWVTVPPIKDALVVNAGDLLHILSNGLYPSVVHRAVVNRKKSRMSIAYLYGPPSNVRISPVGKLVGPSQPPLYRAVTWNEYLGTKAKHFNKALSSVRLCAAATSAPINGLVDARDGTNNRVKVG
ncbi:Gibberellin 3-beta-dioxygenase 1 [Linum grandiflorum]